MAALLPFAAAAVPSVIGGITGARTARAGRRRPRPGLGERGVSATLSRIRGGPLAPEFGGDVLEGGLARRASQFGQRARLRAGQVAQTGRLGSAQRARLFQLAEESLGGNILGATLQARTARAQAEQSERLAREQQELDVARFLEELERGEEQQDISREERAAGLGRAIAGSGAELGLGLLGRILEAREQQRTQDLLNQSSTGFVSTIP